MYIPIYPSFKPVEMGDGPLFDDKFREDPPVISEFTFANIFAWRDAYQFQVSSFGGQLILASRGPSGRRFFPPIGLKGKREAIERIIDDTGEAFIRVPEDIRSLFLPDARYQISPDPDNSDYVYKVEDLVALEGRRYDGKRNLIKNFRSKYGYEYVPLSITNAGECLEFEETWCSIKDCDSVDGLSKERRAIKEMVGHFSEFGIFGGAIRSLGAIRAVALGQRLNARTLVVHVLKADTAMPGLYQVMNNEFLSHNAGDFEFVNMEQDLGLDGLRKSKLSYHPDHMVQKYTLRRI